MPITSFFPHPPCPALIPPGKMWVPPYHPVASGHSRAQLKPAGIEFQLWQTLSLHSWMTGSILHFLPRVRWKERTGERNAHTQVGFYEFISLKICFDSCLHRADWGVVCLSWKAVLCCCCCFFSQTFWVIRKVYLVLTCIVCGKPQNHENIFVTINCRPYWKSSVCDMTTLREWSENVPNARDLLK